MKLHDAVTWLQGMANDSGHTWHLSAKDEEAIRDVLDSHLLLSGKAEKVDQFLSALKRIATLLETHGGHSERMPEEAYRVAMEVIIEPHNHEGDENED